MNEHLKIIKSIFRVWFQKHRPRYWTGPVGAFWLVDYKECKQHEASWKFVCVEQKINALRCLLYSCWQLVWLAFTNGIFGRFRQLQSKQESACSQVIKLACQLSQSHTQHRAAENSKKGVCLLLKLMNKIHMNMYTILFCCIVLYCVV